MHDKQVRRRRAVLVLLVCASLILLTAYFGESSDSPLHSVQRGIAEVFEPIQAGASKVLSPVRDVAGWVSSTIHAKSRNATLNREYQAALAEIGALRLDEIENRQLSSLVKLNDKEGIESFSPLAAHVTAEDPSLWYQTIKVDEGSDAGVEDDDPVVGDGALVGDVTYVGSNFSIVTELTGPKFAVGAEIEDAAGDTGVLQPAVGNPGGLLLQDLPAHTTDIDPSDEVVTSGFQDTVSKDVHSLYPPGIPIGSVATVNPETLLNDQEVTVSPYADLRHLSVVEILTRPYPASSERAAVSEP